MNRQSDIITAIYTRIDRGITPGIAIIPLTSQQETLLRYAEQKRLGNVQIVTNNGIAKAAACVLFPALSIFVGGEQ